MYGPPVSSGSAFSFGRGRCGRRRGRGGRAAQLGVHLQRLRAAAVRARPVEAAHHPLVRFVSVLLDGDRVRRRRIDLLAHERRAPQLPAVDQHLGARRRRGDLQDRRGRRGCGGRRFFGRRALRGLLRRRLLGGRLFGRGLFGGGLLGGGAGSAAGRAAAAAAASALWCRGWCLPACSSFSAAAGPSASSRRWRPFPAAAFSGAAFSGAAFSSGAACCGGAAATAAAPPAPSGAAGRRAAGAVAAGAGAAGAGAAIGARGARGAGKGDP